MYKRTRFIFSDKHRKLTTADHAEHVEITEHDKEDNPAVRVYGRFEAAPDLDELSTAVDEGINEYEIISEIVKCLTGNFEADSRFIMELYEKHNKDEQIKKILINLPLVSLRTYVFHKDLYALSRFFRSSMNEDKK